MKTTLRVLALLLLSAPAGAEPVRIDFSGGPDCQESGVCGTPVTGHYTFERSTAAEPPSGFYGGASGFAYDAIIDFAIETDFATITGTSGRITTDSAYPRLPFSIYFIELSGNDGWTARIHQPYDGPSLALPRDASLMYPPPLFYSPTILLHNAAVYNESIRVPVSQEEKDQCDDGGGTVDCSFGDGTKGFFWSFAVRKTSSPTAVPDGGSTALMLGLGALGVAVMSRRRAVVSVNGRRP